jgi:hypothetical protein
LAGERRFPARRGCLAGASLKQSEGETDVFRDL